MVKNKIKKRTIKILSIISLLTIFLAISTFAYYTNIGKWLDEQQNVYVDGQGQKRLAEDFIVDGCGTGTMLDTVTGLCWDKDLNKGTGTKQYSLVNTYLEPFWNGATYIWPSPRVDADYPAFKVCEDSTTAANTDWRIPSRAELLTLIDEIGPSGTTCTTLSGFGFNNCQNNNYWSSNQRGSSTTSAFAVDLSVGDSYSGVKTSLVYVACVRRD